MNLAKAYEQEAQRIDGQSVAEMEIEARRDAQQAGYDIRANPHPAGSWSALVYGHECLLNWKTNVLENCNGTDRKTNG